MDRTCFICRSPNVTKKVGGPSGSDINYEIWECETCGATHRVFIGDTFNHITLLLKGGKKITAIKVYRAWTGLGLKDAKTFIDQLQALMI